MSECQFGGLFCQFVALSLVQGKMWVLDMICRSLLMSARRSFATGQMSSMDEKVVIQRRGSFIMGLFGPGSTVYRIAI